MEAHEIQKNKDVVGSSADTSIVQTSSIYTTLCFIEIYM